MKASALAVMGLWSHIVYALTSTVVYLLEHRDVQAVFVSLYDLNVVNANSAMC